MPYLIRDIAQIIGEEAIIADPLIEIDNLLVDSRRLVFPATTLFFSLQTERRNGEIFIEELYKAGVRCFVVTYTFNTSPFPFANFLRVDSPLSALQKLAAYHRKQFSYPVIGITGSNGKTIVKEWLYQLLNNDYNIVRSPKSYNSQIGVPLSVWQMNASHTIGIFEAGISQPEEMDSLERIIQPTIGILTNVKSAHSAGFVTKEAKFKEKWKLFKNSAVITCNNQEPLVASVIKQQVSNTHFTWGDETADLYIKNIDKKATVTTICAIYKHHHQLSINIPFTDNASIENAITCWCLLLFLRVGNDAIAKRMQQLQPVEMRLQLKKADNNCSVINDSYSNDLSSLRIALDFLHQQSGNLSSSVILSDLGEVQSEDDQYQKVLQALLQNKVNKFIGIGSRLSSLRSNFLNAIPQAFFYNSVEDFIHQFPIIKFKDEVILIKGARTYEFEQINRLFEQKMHQTVLEVNLSAMAHNLKEYQRFLKPTTKVMAMVKAFSYGSGSVEVASVLQFHKVDYLAVAYADEGIDLRKAGIHMPIMVMNPETITFQSLIQYNLEPELYSFGILTAFNNYLENEGMMQFPVHIKIDTGMHRLGFEQNDFKRLSDFLKTNSRLVIKSVFSHLVASENSVHDGFTNHQAQLFQEACAMIEAAVGYTFLKHIANSAAIFRHTNYQFDMVRLGIGLYGVDSSASKKLNLVPVATLRSTIAQVRKVVKGETVGYSRRGIVQRDSLIATIRIGYADGFSRKLGNGTGKVYINGKFAPVIGSVCMDMTMIDVTDIEGVQEGDRVEIFGVNQPVEQIAEWCETIPYEVMTSVSQRVKREYYEE